MDAKGFIELFESTLTGDQVQLIKDTINYGYWGDAEMDYSEGPKMSEIFITDDAHLGGHFKGKMVGGMFKAIYEKLGILRKPGKDICQAHDWWEDGSGSIIALAIDSDEESAKLSDWSAS